MRCTLVGQASLAPLFVPFIFLLLRIGLTIAGEKPTITEHPLDILVTRGDPATLRCAASGENVVVTWYKDGAPVKVGGAHRLVLPNGSLLLLKVNSGGADSEAGTYYCVVRNEFGEERSQEANLRVASLRDEFRVNPHAVQALIGSQAVLECSPPKGVPEPVVSWRKDDREINFAEESRYNLHPSGNFIIENVERSDAGFYQCLAANMVGQRESKPARLSVYEKPRFLAEPKDMTAEANSSVLFECRVTGEPMPSISWKKRGEPMPVGRAYVTKDSHGLRIDHIQADDAGEYICVAKNPVGSVEASARLHVNAPPRFTALPENVRVAAGQTAAFACAAAGRPQPGIFWSKEGDQDFTFFTGLVSTDGRIQVASDGRLVIEAVRASDAGNYVCAAVNAAGSTLAKAALTVIGNTNFSHPPPVIMFGHQNQTLALNDMAILPCQVRGRVPSTISWYKDGIPLRLDVSADEDPSNERYRQLITGTLQILDLNKSDNGIYTCKAKNEDGETTWTASLTVAERNDPNILIQRMPEMEALPPAPGKPRVLNVTDETVELEWAEKHSATPIIGYIIQYWSPALKESWINVLDVVTTSRFRVKHLRPSHTYVFVVRAENSKGIGPPSEISDFVTTKQTLPDAERERFNELSLEAAHKRLSTEQLVKLVEVRALNATTMLLTWRRQRSEPLVHGYYIKWRGPPLAAPTAGNSPEHSWVNVSDPSAESALVGGLRPATHYEFFVIPYHHSVQGMPSNLLDGTTAEAVPSMPPSDVRLRMLNVTSLRVSWRPPPAHAMNGALKGFLINIRSNQSEERNITTNERATSVTLYRLIADASYAIQVAARTAAGYGPFFVGEPVVMNEETLQNHMRQASDMRHMDAWYRSSANVFILCAILWIMFLVLIVIIWYRCCHRRARHKNFDGGGGASTKDAREFIKIRDGSVVAIGGTPAGAAGTMARNATFWAASSDYNQHTGSSVALSAQMAGSDTCHDNSASCFASNCTGPINGSGMNACPHQHHHQHNYHHPNGHHVDGAGECVNCGAVYGASGSDYGTTLPTLAGTPYYAANGGPACGCAGLGVGAGPGGGGICNPAGCSTLQKPSMRSYSPSHHYHYAQLPDVLSSSNNTDALSTFHNQGSARQYYDDPSPYATTTLVMNNIPGSTHTPRTMHRGGTMAHVHHHFHQPQQHAGLMQPHYIHQHHSAASSSHGNLAAMMGNGGPLLPLNPIPKEPPRNFLSNAAMGAIITDAEMRNAPNWRKSAATAAACCGDVRAAHSGSCGELQDAQLSSKKASCTNCELLQNNYNNNKNKKSVSYNNNKLTQQSCCSIAGNQNLQCCISSTNIGNHSSNQCLRICGTRTTTHRASHHNIDSDCGDEVPPLSSPPPHNFQADYRGSPYTDVSYVQSSDGTNSSAKATKLSPPGNILDLVPPPPTDEPPPSMAAGFINGHAALYDAVSELCAAQKLKKFTPHHQKAYSAELNNNNSSRSSLHNVGSKAQRKGERYNSGSMSRARSRSNKSHQVKSRLSLVERDNDYHGEEDHGDDGVVLGDSALVALCHNRQSASKSGCEHDPLLVDSTGPVGAGGHAHLSRERGGAAGSEDTEADGELSEEERLPSCSSTTTTTMMPMMGIQVRCRTSPNAANTASAATAQ